MWALAHYEEPSFVKDLSSCSEEGESVVVGLVDVSGEWTHRVLE